MVLKFGNDFCTACEPIARIWHKGNDPIGRRTILFVDVYLPEIHAISLIHQNLSTIIILLTVVPVYNLLLTIWMSLAPARTLTLASFMLRYQSWRGLGLWKEQEKERRAPGSLKIPDFTTKWTRVCLFLYRPTACLVFLRRLLVIFLVPPRRFTFFDGCAQLFCTLTPFRTYRIHDKRLKSAVVEPAYYDGRCSHIFAVWVCTTAKISKKPGNEGA